MATLPLISSDSASLRDWFQSQTPEERARWILALSDEEFAALSWELEIARDEQLPPPGNWFTWFLRSGRGFGKTRTGSEWIINRARSGLYGHMALIGQTKGDVRDTMIEVGDSAILKCPSAALWMPDYEPSKRRLTFPNGCVASIYSGDEPDQLRGPQHDTAWVDELAKFKYPKETWENLLFGMRIGPDPRICVTTTPRPIAIIKEIMERPSTVQVWRSSYDNIDNLSPVYIEEVIKPKEGTRLGRQEIYAELMDDVPGALWNRALIESLRISQAQVPQLVRIVVAVDPAITSTEGANETGLIVAGIDHAGNGYVLADLSLRASPDGWAQAAVKAYRDYGADRIVAEANQGGEMVELTIRTADSRVPVKLVRASRGKMTRAEPVAALYEQRKVHHVGMFAELEDQLCSKVPGDDDVADDRYDALVWALTELMLGPSRNVESLNNPFYG